MTHRILSLVVVLCYVVPLFGQYGATPVPSVANCEAQRSGLESYVYVEAVLDSIALPSPVPFSRGITVAVEFGEGTKAFLFADGKKFELWVGTASVPQLKVGDFLEGLADACRLPPDPAEAVKLLSIQWQSKKISEAEFEKLHSGLMSALTEYVKMAQERSAYILATHRHGGGLDAGEYTLVYDNTWEHMKIDEDDLPVNGNITPLIKWIREFRATIEERFHLHIVEHE